VRDAVRTLLAGLAHAGHADAAQRQSAYRAGIKAAGALADNAPTTLDEPPRPKQAQQALETLDALAPPAKRLVVAAMAEAAATDGKLAEREMELIRAACRALHCPIPPLAGMPAT
jgi:uncharacterized membrane protein YebE (DUF533 family)